ncbi:helix-turn-helix domain-containing protein [Paenibacillus chitinolyticus]|uniref:helix-turn-helix domain-containing protein n=1 Tax=Paenibacillus chitinolyticus TaxID=79263 RepID=UPI001C487535|nr:helix-turn-helix transcriptional regulator [Paenibacillus chitinolyticus]MBV6717247.1 helix-turn-helix domain-containing protein [Paenibacillus chitinolyticus]
MSKNTLYEIGQAIRAARINAGLTQEDLAEASGKERGYISDVERGGKNITIRTLDDIAEALNMDTLDMIQLYRSQDETIAAVVALLVGESEDERKRMLNILKLICGRK